MASYIAAGQFCGGLATGFIGGLAANGLGSFLCGKAFGDYKLLGAAGGITANVFYHNIFVSPKPTPFAEGTRIGLVTSNVFASAIQPILYNRTDNRAKSIFQSATRVGIATALVGWAISGVPMAIVAGGVASYARAHVLSQRQAIRA